MLLQKLVSRIRTTVETSYLENQIRLKFDKGGETVETNVVLY